MTSTPTTSWKQLTSREIFTSKRIRILEDLVELPNGELITYTYLDKQPGVVIIPILNDGNILLIRQYRYLVGMDCWQLPAGGVAENETPYQAGLRELREETGLVANTLRDLGVVYSSYGISKERVYMFAAGSLRQGPPNLELTEENIVVKSFPLAKCIEMVMDGTICAGISSLLILKLSRLLEAEKDLID